MPIALSGTTHDRFFDRTKAALESFQSSPIKRDSLVRQFLTHQLDQPNEHTLPEAFTESAQSTHPGRCHLLSVLHYEFNEDGRGLILDSERISNHVCLSKESLEAKIKEAFRECFPDHDGVASDTLDIRVVDDRVELISEEQDNEGLRAELEEMDASEMVEWLCDNFNDRELAEDILPVITHEMDKIVWEELNVEG